MDLLFHKWVRAHLAFSNMQKQDTGIGYPIYFIKINLYKYMNISYFERSNLILYDDHSIWFKNTKELKPNDQFNYTVEDIIVDKRIDIDFFEFVSISYLHRPGVKLDPYVNVFPDFITGVATAYNDTTPYNLTLKYTNYTDGEKHREIDKVFLHNVGPIQNENNLDDETTNPLMIIGIVVIVIVFISLLVYLIYKR